MRVFIGVYNIANLMTIYAQGLRQLGFHVDCFEIEPHPFYNLDTIKIDTYQSDLADINNLVIRGSHVIPHKDEMVLDFFEDKIKKYLNYDIYIFMNCMSIIPGNIDFPILKRNGKIIISLFSGSEVRHHVSAHEIWSTMNNHLPASMKLNQVAYKGYFYDYFNIIKSSVYENSIEKKIQNIMMAERYADLILSVPEQSGLQMRPYNAYIHAVDPNKLKHKAKKRGYPVIAHIPSNPHVKRSDLIISALDELRAEGLNFKTIIKSNIKHSEVIDILSEADILIDQLGNFPALLSHEAMGSGCTVLTGNHPLAMPIPLAENHCPAVHIDPHNYKDKIREVILDEPLRKQKSKDSVEYIHAFATPLKAAERLIKSLEYASSNRHDYFPLWAHQNMSDINRSVQKTISDIIDDALAVNGVPDLGVQSVHRIWEHQYNHLGGWTYCRHF